MTETTPRARGDLMVVDMGAFLIAVLLTSSGESGFFIPLFGKSAPSAALDYGRNVRLHQRLG